jgi:hypothetical protein
LTIPSETNGYPVTSIGTVAFSYCTSLTNIAIPNSITNIGVSTFNDCASLASLTIPDSVTSIGSEAFAYDASLAQIYFTGNAPAANANVFLHDGVTVYYVPVATGWSSFASNTGIPAVPWLPAMQATGPGFGFNINWASGQTVVVEACTNLVHPVWQPVQTNTLTTGTAYFSDPRWTNSPGSFYRLRSP